MRLRVTLRTFEKVAIPCFYWGIALKYADVAQLGFCVKQKCPGDIFVAKTPCMDARPGAVATGSNGGQGCPRNKRKSADVAQLVEQLIRNQ